MVNREFYSKVCSKIEPLSLSSGLARRRTYHQSGEPQTLYNRPRIKNHFPERHPSINNNFLPAPVCTCMCVHAGGWMYYLILLDTTLVHFLTARAHFTCTVIHERWFGPPRDKVIAYPSTFSAVKQRRLSLELVQCSVDQNMLLCNWESLVVDPSTWTDHHDLNTKCTQVHYFWSYLATVSDRPPRDFLRMYLSTQALVKGTSPPPVHAINTT